jgi:hypothetical protein
MAGKMGKMWRENEMVSSIYSSPTTHSRLTLYVIILYVIKKILLDLLTSLLSTTLYKFEIMPRVKQAPVKEWQYRPRKQLALIGTGTKKEEEEEEKDEEIRINALLQDDPEETVSSHQYCQT